MNVRMLFACWPFGVLDEIDMLPLTGPTLCGML